MATRYPLVLNGTTIQELQSGDSIAGLATVATTGSYTDLSDKPTIPTAVSQLTNDSNYITSSAAAAAYQPLDADLTAFAAKTAPTGDVVGTSDTQTLTNKTATGFRETRVAMPANDINMSNGNYFTKTISGATTLTVSNAPTTGTAQSFILDLTNGGSATITWWANTKWAGGTAPTLTSAGRDVLGFFTHDGGTTWNGLVLGKDVK